MRVLLAGLILLAALVASSSAECPANQTYSTCYSDCRHSCNDYYKKDIGCAAVCSKGCKCESGFVRDKPRNACVKPADCREKPVCGRNETFYQFGSCVGTCNNKEIFCTEEVRPPVCDCRRDYVRDRLFRCIHKNDC